MRSLRRHTAESSLGALGLLGFGLSASMPKLHPRRLPSRLTSRSSRRRVVASLKLVGMRAILAPTRRVRRGLTPALGGRRAFCKCAAHRLCSQASVSAAFRVDCRRVATSSKFAGRAHTSHVRRVTRLRKQRSATVRFPAPDPLLRRRPADSSRGALRLSCFGFRQAHRGLRVYRHPTRLTIRSSRPHVVAAAVCCALRLHTSAAPPRVGLTQALGAMNESCHNSVKAQASIRMFLRPKKPCPECGHTLSPRPDLQRSVELLAFLSGAITGGLLRSEGALVAVSAMLLTSFLVWLLLSFALFRFTKFSHWSDVDTSASRYRIQIGLLLGFGVLAVAFWYGLPHGT